jgi:hypothetical protein
VQQGNVLIPDDWLLLTWDEPIRVLPPQLDGAAEAARNAPGGAFLGPWMESTMAQPFTTAFHVCGGCRAALKPLAALATARLRERQEVKAPEPAPVPMPSLASVIPLRAVPPQAPEPPEKPYADCPLWSDSERIGVLGRCKEPKCLQTRRCQVTPDSPIVFVHEDAPPPKKPRKP